MRPNRPFAKCITALLLSTVLLSGCAAKTQTAFTLHSQDCQSGNVTTYLKTYSDNANTAYTKRTPVLKTQQGYYTNVGGKKLKLYYHDIASGKDILLCNKPECKHDGNEYCVATNAKYSPLAYQMYDGYLYVAAKCMDDEKLEYKLLRIAPDGSSLTEVAAYYSTISGTMDTEENTTQIPKPASLDSLLIHRNYAILPFSCKVDAVQDDLIAYGTAILNLETKEVTYADPEPVSADNLPWICLNAHGDYVYYVRQEDKKRVLHRRSLTDGTDVSLSLLTNFSGEYAVLDDDTIAYLRTRGRFVFLHHPSDGSNEEMTVYSTMDDVFQYDIDDETGLETNVSATLEKVERHEVVPSFLYDDGTYFYALTYPSSLTAPSGQPYVGPTNVFVHIYNEKLEEIQVVPVPNPNLLLGKDIFSGEMDHYYSSFNIEIRFLGNEVIMIYQGDLFSCDMESFLSGEPDFQHIYTRPTN
ncbi:MAG: hypothetical protein IKS85_07830 [Lachnospiraceae bacterium]|nr:hypothetical protein [Lachnospiraceae bacterium]